MDKKIAGLLGAVASVATLGGVAQATPAAPTNDQMAVRSYADLLAPVPNALEALRADDVALASQPVTEAGAEVQVAQYYYHHHHHHRYYHHHHHHHRVIIIHRHRRYYHHHHHHHHHHGAFIGVPGIGGVVVGH